MIRGTWRYTSICGVQSAGVGNQNFGYRTFAAHVDCWRNWKHAADTHITNEIKDELRDVRDRNVIAWNGREWVLK